MVNEDGGGFGYTSLASVFFSKKKKKQVLFERIRTMLWKICLCYITVPSYPLWLLAGSIGNKSFNRHTS